MITPEPREVGRQDVRLSVLVDPQTDIPAGAQVELRLPSTGEVSFTAAAVATAPACDLLGPASPEALPV